MDGDAGAFPDRDGLADGFEDRVALVPHMREIDATVLAGHRAEGDQLIRGRVDRRRIDQGRGHADGSVLHPLSHQRLHLFELLGRRRNVLVAKHHAPHLSQADVVDHVDRDPVALHDREVLGVAAPAQRVAVDHGRVAERGLALGRGRAPLAGQVGGDALAELALGARRIGDQHEAGLAHHVDEPRRYHASASKDGPPLPSTTRASVRRTSKGASSAGWPDGGAASEQAAASRAAPATTAARGRRVSDGCGQVFMRWSRARGGLRVGCGLPTW